MKEALFAEGVFNWTTFVQTECGGIDESHSVLQEMLCGHLFFAALFCCMFSKSKTYATDVKIVDLKQGGNAELKLPQRQLHLNSFTVCSSVYPIYSARLSFPILTMNIHNEYSQ